VAITKMELMELVRNAEGGDVDFLREGVRVLAQALMEAEVSAQIGAELGERNREGRTAQRNGYRDSPRTCGARDLVSVAARFLLVADRSVVGPRRPTR
jgi:transposase-like protein